MPPRKKIPAPPTTDSYWHGGPAGLQVGDMLLPAQELEHLREIYASDDFADCDPSRVYLTTSPLIAEAFAAQCVDWTKNPPEQAPGAVYEVEPIGDRADDFDYPGDACFLSCDRARIIGVRKTGLLHASRPALLALLSHQTWDDGSPLYDAQGYGLPSTTAQTLGVNRHHLRSLGIGPDIEDIDRRCIEVLVGLDITPEQIADARESVTVGS